jgi:hypothetical protein
MDKINITDILNRNIEANRIKQLLTDFQTNKHNLSTKRGFYIYGDPGTGKTEFVVSILKDMNYDIIKYDAGDIRNKAIIDNITKQNMSDKNIVSLFYRKVQPIAIIMDEIDGMNNGDKGGINSLIKIIRPKKTKKQKLEEITLTPIICIGNYHMDKKIKELMKVCHVFELKPPTSIQIHSLLNQLLPDFENYPSKTNILNFIQGDLRKVKSFCQNPQLFRSIDTIFSPKSYNEDTRNITKKIINQQFNLAEHSLIMNETDRTIVGLLWHENIIDVLSKLKKEESIPLYLEMLENMCFADYIDRITFQKQIWQFNEMSSLIKTFKNNKIYHESTFSRKKPKFNPSEVRFTKVLTKYSTEYNNSVFIQNLCQELGMDRSDMFAFFIDMRKRYPETEMITLFENYDISKLDINRLFRYLDKFTNIDSEISDEETEDEDHSD